MKPSLPEPSPTPEEKNATAGGHEWPKERYQPVSQAGRRGSQWRKSRKSKMRTRGTVSFRSLRTQWGKLTALGCLLVQKGGKERKQARGKLSVIEKQETQVSQMGPESFLT